jgi:phosphoribosyl 1,2-cyclic phosphodiesterase
MTVLASGSRGNATVISAAGTRLLVDAGLSCREILRRMALVGEDPAQLDAILITHEHLDHVAGLAVLARRLGIPVFFTEATHRAWVRMVKPRTTMTYAKWLDHMQAQKEQQIQENGAARAARTTSQHAPAHILAAVSGAAVAEAPVVDVDMEDDIVRTAGAGLQEAGQGSEPVVVDEDAEPDMAQPAKNRLDPASLPAVEYFRAGQSFTIGAIEIEPFTIPHDAADPCGFVFHARSESIRMAVATDLGYIPPNVKSALKNVDVLLLESNHDLEMLKDGPYPWSVKQRVLSRVGHLSNAACAEFLLRDYDGGAHSIVLGHLSEQNNLPELARLAAEQAIGGRMSLLGNRLVLAAQDEPLEPICL